MKYKFVNHPGQNEKKGTGDDHIPMSQIGVRYYDSEGHPQAQVQQTFRQTHMPMLLMVKEILQAKINVRREARRQHNRAEHNFIAHAPGPPCNRDNARARLQSFFCSQSVVSETTIKLSRARCSFA